MKCDLHLNHVRQKTGQCFLKKKPCLPDSVEYTGHIFFHWFVWDLFLHECWASSAVVSQTCPSWHACCLSPHLWNSRLTNWLRQWVFALTLRVDSQWLIPAKSQYLLMLSLSLGLCKVWKIILMSLKSFCAKILDSIWSCFIWWILICVCCFSIKRLPWIWAINIWDQTLLTFQTRTF